MKKFFLMMTLLLSMAASSQAMSYEQARQQALFLADKMAYELNLTEAQYEACYEINLDYLMGVTGRDNLYGDYWTRRNLDMSYILLDWQYRAFVEAAYFYRPLYWADGHWRFGIYARYPHRSYFYFGRPAFWNTYRGGHAWHHHPKKSWYHGRDFGHRNHNVGSHGVGHSNRNDHKPNGMRDKFDNGSYGRGQHLGDKPKTQRFDKMPQSSTRSTVTGNRTTGSNRSTGSYSRSSTIKRDNGNSQRGSAVQNSSSSRPSRQTFGTTTRQSSSSMNRSTGTRVQRSTSTPSFSRSSGTSRGSSRSSGASRGGGSRSNSGGGSNGGRR